MRTSRKCYNLNRVENSDIFTTFVRQTKSAMLAGCTFITTNIESVIAVCVHQVDFGIDFGESLLVRYQCKFLSFVLMSLKPTKFIH